MASNARPELRNGAETTLTSLVTGIVGDIQTLLKQQLDFFKLEMRADFQKTKEAVLSLLVGGLILFTGFICLVFMLVHLLHWAADIPLWGCFAWIGGGLVFLGGILTYLGISRFETFNPLPDETAQTLKENIQCLTTKK